MPSTLGLGTSGKKLPLSGLQGLGTSWACLGCVSPTSLPDQRLVPQLGAKQEEQFGLPPPGGPCLCGAGMGQSVQVGTAVG